VAVAATEQDFSELSACVSSGNSLTGSFGRLIAWIRRAAPLEDPPRGEWQNDLKTLVQKLSETRRHLSSTTEYLNRAKKMVECHIARKIMEEAIEEAQEATQIDDLAEADLSYRWLAARATEFGRLIGGKKGISYPQDLTMLREAEETLEKLQSWRLSLWQAQHKQPHGKGDQIP
jgi:phosphoribosyl-ATP pyrophosphohydrolase